MAIRKVWEQNKKIFEYGIVEGDLLIFGDNLYTKPMFVKQNHLSLPIAETVKELFVYRRNGKSLGNSNLMLLATIYKDQSKDFVEKHPQAELTLEDLRILAFGKHNLNRNSPCIAYSYKKGKSYVIKKVSIETLKTNFDSIVSNVNERNFYWRDAPDIEFTKQAWFKMSRRQKRDFKEWLESK